VRVWAIQTGTVVVRPRQVRGEGRGAARALWTLADRRWTEPLPILAWLIEHPEGMIVVDTGETSRVGEPGHLPRWHPYFRLGLLARVRPEEEIGPQLRALGVEPADVRWVVMTHLHGDHAGGLGAFAGCDVLVCRREYEHARGAMGALRGYLPQRWPEGFAPRLFDLRPEPFGPFPESLRVTAAGDVTVVGTHGHTAGHVSVVLSEAGERLLVFAGDASYTQALMLEGAVDGVADDPVAAGRALGRLRALAHERPVVYLPSHDPGAEARLQAREPVPR
jgi:N-acyl homoserine lactone hydrolase